jgi:hypothetical protein
MLWRTVRYGEPPCARHRQTRATAHPPDFGTTQSCPTPPHLLDAEEGQNVVRIDRTVDERVAGALSLLHVDRTFQVGSPLS